MKNVLFPSRFAGKRAGAHLEPHADLAGELAERIKALCYEYSERILLATAIGVLEIVKGELITEDVMRNFETYGDK